MKNILYSFLLIVVISCNKKFNPDEYKGTWISINENDSYFNLPSIVFRSDSIFFEDSYTYVLKGIFKIKKNTITYKIGKNTISNNFFFNSKDSSITIGKNNFYYLENYTYNSNFKSYDLIGIKNKDKITIDSLRRFDNGFHILKTKNDSLIFKFNDKFTSDKNDISRFVFNNSSMHFDIPISIIYIGKNISLNDLILCYREIWSTNRRRVLLITDYDIKTNLYSGFLDAVSF